MKTYTSAGLTFLLLLAFTTAGNAETKIKSLCGIHYPSDSLVESNCLLLK